MSEYALFARRVGLVGITMLITSLKGLVLLPILTKTLGAEGFGAWSLILATISLITPFIMLGLATSILRFLSAETEKKKFGQEFYAVIFTILFVGMIFSFMIFVFSDYLSVSLLKNISFSPEFRMVSFLIILEALNQVTIQAFRIFGEIKKYSIFMGLQTLIEIGLVSFSVLSGYGLKGAIIALIITRGISLILSLLYIIQHVGLAFPNFSSMRPYLIFGIPLVSSVVFEIIISSSDRYVIGFFMGAASVGIYSAAYSIGTVAKLSIGPLTYILSPTIFKSFDENKIDEVKKYLSYSLKYFLMFSIPSVFGVAALAAPLLQTLTTSEFVLSGILIVPIVALSMIFEGVRAIFGEVLMLFKRTKIFGSSSVIAGSINLVLNFVFVPNFGITAAALATLISYSIIGFIMYYNSRKYLKFDVNPRFIVKSIISSTIMVFPVWLLQPTGMMGILEAAGIGGITYFMVLFALNGFEKKELRIIRESLIMING
jgi:O-antigen/teichoic acid export membrane protein